MNNQRSFIAMIAMVVAVAAIVYSLHLIYSGIVWGILCTIVTLFAFGVAFVYFIDTQQDDKNKI